MTIPVIVGVVVGVVAIVIGYFRAVSGANRRIIRNPAGTVYNLWPTTVVFGLLWGGVAFGVALVVTLLV